jgi:hypothetical protein
MQRSLGALAAVGAPVIKDVLDAAKIAPGRADSYALLRQPKLIHIGFQLQSPVQSIPGNLVEPFPRPTKTSFVHTPH